MMDYYKIIYMSLCSIAVAVVTWRIVSSIVAIVMMRARLNKIKKENKDNE